MRTIVVAGAGRSSSSLISYLIAQASQFDWNIIVGDASLPMAEMRVGGASRAQAVALDVQNEARTKEIVAPADVIISLLPPALHIAMARICLTLNKHLLTASYVTPEMRQLDAEARSRKLLFLNECGLDPGIDHMSAMLMIEEIRAKGGKITSFESFTGGLIAPDTDVDNPWRYKFTWNPRNVVVAGQSTAKFLRNGKAHYLPYQQLFKRTTSVSVPGYGKFDGYANRDSLSYQETYGLNDIKTMLRGTLRYEGYCQAWDILVQLGCCDDSYPLAAVGNLTHREFIQAFLENADDDPVSQISKLLQISAAAPAISALKWSGFFDDTPVGLNEATPAKITEHILQKKWTLRETDKDMVVMYHRLRYTVGTTAHTQEASLVVIGEDATETAMAKTVGLPLGIAAKLLLTGSIKQTGVCIPITEEFYRPILDELKTFGIDFVAY